MAIRKSKSKTNSSETQAQIRKDKINELFAGIKYQNPNDKDHMMDTFLKSDLPLEFIEDYVKQLLTAGYGSKPISIVDRSTNIVGYFENSKFYYLYKSRMYQEAKELWQQTMQESME